MQYISHYASPLGELLLAAEEDSVTGLWFAGAKYYARTLSGAHVSGETDALRAAKRWLDEYFSGREPAFLPPLRPGGTPFQRAVWALLQEIPYGQLTTYGALAKELARRQGRARLSAQAVGGAVGHNPISILIPCHRVVGADGSLTGYAGGVDKKLALLKREGAPVANLFVPKRGAAL